MTKNKKMASLGLIIALIGGLMVPVGVYMFNKYSGKARSEDHKELIKGQHGLGDKVDSSKMEIIEEVKKGNEEARNSKAQEIKKSTVKQEPVSKNEIINYAPNQGVQINENKGTVIVPKPLQRNFSVNDAKKILKDYPSDFPIEVWLKGTNPESKNLFNQVVDAIKSLGYTNIVTTVIGLYGTTETIEKDFQYGADNGKFIFSIYIQQ